MYLIAIKLDDFADDFDPYGYAKTFNSRIDGIENFMTGLTKDADLIINWLKAIINECKQRSDYYHESKAYELIREITEWISLT